MGAEATLIAIGPFSDDLIPYMDYGLWDYKNVNDGDRVVTTLIRCRTTEASKDLAESLGFDYMDLGKHVMQPITKGVHRGLVRFAISESGQRAAEIRMESIDVLAKRRGWMFVYQPNC